MTIGERIQTTRKENGFSQEQLAEMASLNRVTIAKYESGRIEPGAQALARIADALGVSIDHLLGRDEGVDPDEEWEMREQMRRNPEMRALFSAAKRASPAHLRAVYAMLKALKDESDE